jgi:hypothetical protein
MIPNLKPGCTILREELFKADLSNAIFPAGVWTLEE